MSDIYDEGGFSGVPAAMDFLVNGIFAVAGRADRPPKCSSVASASRSFPNQKGLHLALRGGTSPHVEAVFYRTAPFRAATKSTTGPGWPGCPPSSPEFHLRHSSYAIVFSWGLSGDTAHLCLDARTCCNFLAPSSPSFTYSTKRGEDDILVAAGWYSPSSAPCYTIPRRDPALRAALLFPPTSPDSLEHLKANRAFFESQMDRFILRSAPQGMLQTEHYR